MELKIDKRLIDEAVQDAAAEIKQNFVEKSALENLIDNKSFEITNPFNTYQFIRAVRVADLYNLIEEVGGNAEEPKSDI